MRPLRVSLALVLFFATSGCQFDREEEERTHRMAVVEPEHDRDPVAWHASDQPEGLDPPGPKPLFGPRRDPDTIPREGKPAPVPYGEGQNAWEEYLRSHALLEER